MSPEPSGSSAYWRTGSTAQDVTALSDEAYGPIIDNTRYNKPRYLDSGSEEAGRGGSGLSVCSSSEGGDGSSELARSPSALVYEG